MSLSDRDYVRPIYGQGGRGGSYGASPRWLIGGSIVTTLIIINVAIYVIGSLSPAAAELIFGLGAMQAKAVSHGQVWRLLTAQYLHASVGHLLLNMIGLHFLGRPLEGMWSPRRFFAIYTVCGLFGNVFYTILGSFEWLPPTMPAVGASGCIYGLLGIVAVLFPQATLYVYFLFPIRIRTAAIIFGGISVLSVLERGQNYGGEAVHLAGLVFGVWWAMKGERWWSNTEWRLPRRSGARLVRPPGAKEGQTPTANPEVIDRILKKVYDRGLSSLTEDERRTLRQATDRQRTGGSG